MSGPRAVIKSSDMTCNQEMQEAAIRVRCFGFISTILNTSFSSHIEIDECFLLI